jgi:ribosome modulation factor
LLTFDSATAPDVTKTEGTVIYSTSTSLCPYTTVETVSGKEVTVTSTSYSLIVTQVPQAETSKVTVAPAPTTVGTVIYSTSTSVCPYTTVETISGVAVTVTSTSYSLIVTQVGQAETSKVTVAPAPTTVGTVIYSISTSVCPYTTVETVSGVAVTYTSTSYSLIVTGVTQVETSKVTVAPPPTTVQTYVLSTSTSYCPVTEIQTISGLPVTVVSTQTSLVEVKVPTTVVAYTTQESTVYETDKVYQTTTCIETYYTTVSAGETHTIATTLTNTIKATEHLVITKTSEASPVTIATSIPVTEVVTIPSEETVTKQGVTYISTYKPTIIATLTGPAVVTTLPALFSTVTAPAVETTLPSAISTVSPPVAVNTTIPAPPLVTANGAASHNAPLALAFAGAIAFLAIA